MKKLMISIGLSLITISSILAQQKDYEWRIGVSGGYSNYYGDLTPYRIRGVSNWDAIHHLLYFNENYFDQYSWKISLERQLSPTIGLQFSYGQYQFAMSDRYVQRNGELLGSNRFFNRALNFQNNTRDMGLAFVFKADNDRLIPANSWIAPYASLGFGILDFNVSGDLLDDDGNRYDYTNPNVQLNGIYETELTPLRTELREGYDQGVFYANLGLGVRFRLGSRFEIFAQSDFIHSFSDYLDDVSGQYRSDYDNDFQAYAAQPGTNTVDPNNPNRGRNNGLNDWIIYHGIGLKYNFGVKKSSFRAPKLSTNYPNYQVGDQKTSKASIENNNQKQDSTKAFSSGNTYNYFTNIQLIDQARLDSLSYRSQILTWNQQVEERRRRILEGKVREKSLVEIDQKFEEQDLLLKADTLLSSVERDSLIQFTEKRRQDLRYSLDSIQRREIELKTEIDSIQSLSRAYQIQPSSSVNFGLDSLWRNITFNDRNAIKTLQEERSLIDTANASPVSKSATATPKTGTNEQASSSEEQKRLKAQEEKIQKLEQESKRLQTQRDSLSALPREFIYMGGERSRSIAPDLSDRNRSVEKESTTINQTTIEERRVTETAEDDRERKNFFQRIGAFFGGAATARALDSNTSNSSTTPTVSREVVSGPVQAYRDSQAAVEEDQLLRAQQVATTLGFLLARITPEMIESGRSAMIENEQETQKEEKASLSEEIKAEITEPIEIEIKTDTIFVDRAPEIEIQLLRFKEIIYFDINQRIPPENELKKLANLVDFLKENEGYQLVLTGYADNTGNVNYNLKLAGERTKAVADALGELYGISEDQIQMESGGQVVRGSQRSSNEQDRKVEVRIERRN
jgi:outer membrane protein OmpA-like peptidoglycan-associated protein